MSDHTLLLIIAGAIIGTAIGTIIGTVYNILAIKYDWWPWN